jgi:hypothetical protein
MFIIRDSAIFGPSPFAEYAVALKLQTGGTFREDITTIIRARDERAQCFLHLQTDLRVYQVDAEG